MKKPLFWLDKLSFVICCINLIAVCVFVLTAGRLVYTPESLHKILFFILDYAYMGGLGISGIIGIVVNVISVIGKKKNCQKIQINILYFFLFGITILVSRFLFFAAMSI